MQVFCPASWNMSKTIIGKKLGMTQIYLESGELVPVTVIEAGPCTIFQLKTEATDGYSAVQIGFGVKKEKQTSQAAKGHAKQSGTSAPLKLTEFRSAEDENFKVGETIGVADFAAETKVDVIGITKGRGFQGVVKRWDFSGGPASHGSMFHRRGGSYGMCQWPGEVIKGKKMPGRYGTDRKTVQNLRVIRVDTDKNLILVKGSVPGPTGAFVLVRKAIKTRKSA
jgi:large subunit ribosomal protein L3